MGAPVSVPLTKIVAPGETVDVSVTLTAPDDGGTYRGNWMMRNAANTLFGIGDGTKAFWVQIKVSVESGLLYDFLVNAGSAEWEVGVGSEAGDSLAFGGDDNDPNGVAKIKDKVKLESGATSGKHRPDNTRILCRVDFLKVRAQCQCRIQDRKCCINPKSEELR